MGSTYIAYPLKKLEIFSGRPLNGWILGLCSDTVKIIDKLGEFSLNNIYMLIINTWMLISLLKMDE